MPGPLHSRLIARAGATRNYLVASVLVGAVTAGLLIVQAGLVADAVTTVFDTLALPEGWAAGGQAPGRQSGGVWGGQARCPSPPRSEDAGSRK